ncbi:hypothetical protein BDW60DRAFT_201449 [Aspergillus nidulans var. acristatus]
MNLTQILAKYDQERDKRLRPDGLDQYASIPRTEKYKHFGKDPWKNCDNPHVHKPRPMGDGDHCKILIVGAGFSALLFAVRFLDAGFLPEDIVFIYSAWGFGGTWYWNRYPGLMCDVESSCYMPLLEETGYTPKHRYSYGPELREYAELVADQWKLADRAMFGTTIQTARWDSGRCQWVTSVTIENSDSTTTTTAAQLRSDYFVLASGFLNRPKLPQLQGLVDFQGHMFHTSRWDYDYTGGSPTQPELHKLRGKKVAFLGTGATGIQVIPQLAKWAGHLTVLQRTPSAVGVRGQRPVNPIQWKQEVQCGPGWQRQRRENMAAFLSNIPDLPAKSLVDDGWTHFPSFSGLVGSPRTIGLDAKNVSEYVERLHRLDFPRQQSIRDRVTDIVKDPVTAASLQPWYPGWCKRPCFHDEYLDTFNLPHVTLADTDGHGIHRFTKNGVLYNTQEIEADVVILGTGFEPFSAGSPAFRAGITINGRDGISMDEKWKEMPGTFHGLLTRGFPNLFLSGPTQAGSTVNVVHSVDVLATHASHILKKALLHAPKGQRLLLEPTWTAEEAWSMRVAEGAYGYAALTGCTPSYITREGARMRAETPTDQLRMARGLSWSRGILDFIATLEHWEANDDLGDLEVHYLERGNL